MGLDSEKVIILTLGFEDYLWKGTELILKVLQKLQLKIVKTLKNIFKKNRKFSMVN